MANKIEQIIGCQIGEICTGLPRPVPEPEDIEAARKLLATLDAAGLEIVEKQAKPDIEEEMMDCYQFGKVDPSTCEPTE